MSKVVILGSGAAPGVPSLSCGWGACNAENSKNRRSRSSCYIELNGVNILIDTSPDLRCQLLDNNITELDAVLYTHSHADHLHGIDDLREITRIRLDKALREGGKTYQVNDLYGLKETKKFRSQSIECYGSSATLKTIKKRFGYLLASNIKKQNIFFVPSINCNVIKPNHPFSINGLKVSPLKLLGHSVTSVGYAFNDGEVVYIADFKQLASSVFKQIKVRPKLLIMPLTTPFGHPVHAGFDEVMAYVKEINPEHVVLNHMASECDYDAINALTPEFVEPAYDGLTINL